MSVIAESTIVCRFDLDDGEAVIADGSTVTDSASGRQVPAVVLRMAPDRAHELAHIVDDWMRMASGVQIRGYTGKQRALVSALEDSAAIAGDLEAADCRAEQAGSTTAARRVAAIAVLHDNEPGLDAEQRVAVVEAAGRWMDEGDVGHQQARALLAAVCSDLTTTGKVFEALSVDSSGSR